MTSRVQSSRVVQRGCRLPVRRSSSKLAQPRNRRRRSMDVASPSIGKIAMLWRGDRAMRESATPASSRLRRIFDELDKEGIEATPAVYAEEFHDEVRDQILHVDGVLVWVDPLSDGRTRVQLDPLLREVARQGIWVSSHPDTILKMGTKEVLYKTRHLGWGTDTHIY